MSFIDAHEFSVDLVLRVLGIPASTYYDWRARQAAPSRRALQDAQLLEMIVKIRCSHEFAATYRSPRVWLELRRQGIRVGRKRVERIMREHGLQGAFLRKGWKGGSTKQNPRQRAAPDLVNRHYLDWSGLGWMVAGWCWWWHACSYSSGEMPPSPCWMRGGCTSRRCNAAGGVGLSAGGELGVCPVDQFGFLC
jgi:HTH-like domain